MVTIAVIFALECEARPFRRLARRFKHVSVYVSGVGPTRARRTAEHVLREPLPGRVIAAGFCGALASTLRVGDVVQSPRIVTVDHLVADPADKRRLAELHDADAVDMESAAIAAACAAKAVPFLAVRAVSDTSDTTLSPELVKLLSGGNVSIGKVCLTLLRKPSLVWEFRQLARNTKLAAQNLSKVLVKMVSS